MDAHGDDEGNEAAARGMLNYFYGDPFYGPRGSRGSFLYMATASGEEPEVPPGLCQPL